MYVTQVDTACSILYAGDVAVKILLFHEVSSLVLGNRLKRK